MTLKDIRIGFAMTGSFCTFEAALSDLNELAQAGAKITPILSFAAASTGTRFGKAEDLIKNLRVICGAEPIITIEDAEPIGPQKLLDALVVHPCTGNSLAKIANAITDTPVTMAVKAHLRNARPVILGISTNDGLGANLKNIGMLMAMKNVYFVPFYQDNPTEKPRSLVANGRLIPQTVEAALKGQQVQPIIDTDLIKTMPREPGV